MPPDPRYLTFHGVGAPGRELEPGEGAVWISAGQLEDILDAVRDVDGLGLTFDDGNASDVELGLPELRRRGLSATFFPIAGRLGTPGSVGARDLEVLRDAGMGIGTHGMAHVPWRRLPEATAQREMVEARRLLEDVVGRPIRAAACPRGVYDRGTIRRLERLGYERAFTSDGLHRRRRGIVQPRYSVRAGDDGDSVLRRLAARPSPLQRGLGELKQAYKRLRP